MRRGKVVGSLPDGFSSPRSSAASARPNSWPGYQAWSTAGTRSSHGIATGLPALSTTIVRGLAAATASTSSSWRPGNESERRS